MEKDSVELYGIENINQPLSLIIFIVMSEPFLNHVLVMMKILSADH